MVESVVRLTSDNFVKICIDKVANCNKNEFKSVYLHI